MELGTLTLLPLGKHVLKVSDLLTLTPFHSIVGAFYYGALIYNVERRIAVERSVEGSLHEMSLVV